MRFRWSWTYWQETPFIPRLLYVLYKQLLHVCDTLYPHFSTALPPRHKILWLCKILAKNLLSLLKQNRTDLKQMLSFWQHICTNKLCKRWCGNNRARQLSAALLRSCPQNVSNCNSCQHALKNETGMGSSFSAQVFHACSSCTVVGFKCWLYPQLNSILGNVTKVLHWCIEWHFRLPKACSRSKTEQEEGERESIPTRPKCCYLWLPNTWHLAATSKHFLYDATSIFSWSQMMLLTNST